MLGLVPGAAAFATNLLNDPIPGDQNSFTLAVLVLTLALLLWTSYTSSVAGANRAHVKLTGDARWDFWESGLVAMAALIVIGILLPPMSTVDRTVDFENSAFSSWAQLQERLNHPVPPGQGVGLGGTTGFSLDVSLDGPLVQSKVLVFTYTKLSSYAGPVYFRGVNQTQTSEGEWRFATVPADHQAIASGASPTYTENYHDLALGSLQVNMILPPSTGPDILFYPGQLDNVNRDSIAYEALPQHGVQGLVTVDRLNSIHPSASTGTYRVIVAYSTATDVQLRSAGTRYPDWLAPYLAVPKDGSYRTQDVENRVHQLALKIVNNAKAKNPYDEATAIEAYLRTNYTYTLRPRLTFGQDPIDFFLFNSKEGFCAFFASAMGDMLRSLGIPTRLASGYGPGTQNPHTGLYEVRAADGHSWVESYFPGYGWITFEPTPQAGYDPILRGTQGENLCLRDLNCDHPLPTPGGVVTPTHRPGGVIDVPPGGAISAGSSTFKFHLPDAGTMTRIVGVLLALLLILLAAVLRYLRPRTIASVWKRTLTLASMAGAERRAGETPFELGRRLQQAFPEASEPVGALASGFAVAAYAPPDLASSVRLSVMEAWTSLRPMLLRRILARFRPNSY
jgi:transglutaminase-like putative cysteine protease